MGFEEDYDKEYEDFLEGAKENAEYMLQKEYIDSRRDAVSEFNKKVMLARDSFKYVSYRERKDKVEQDKLDMETAEEEYKSKASERKEKAVKGRKLASEIALSGIKREQNNIKGQFNMIASEKDKMLAKEYVDGLKGSPSQIQNQTIEYILDWFDAHDRGWIREGYNETMENLSSAVEKAKAKEERAREREESKQRKKGISKAETALKKLEKEAVDEPQAYRDILEMFDGDERKATDFVFEWNKKSLESLNEGFVLDVDERDRRAKEALYEAMDSVASMNPSSEYQAKKLIKDNEYTSMYPNLFKDVSEALLETGRKNEKEAQRQSKRDYEARHPGRHRVENPKPRGPAPDPNSMRSRGIKNHGTNHGHKNRNRSHGSHKDHVSEFNKDSEGKPHLSPEELQQRWADNISYAMVVSSEQLRADVRRVQRAGGKIKQGLGSQSRRQGKILQMSDNLLELAKNIQLLDAEQLSYFIANFMVTANKFFDYESLEWDEKSGYYNLMFDHRERSDWKLSPALAEYWRVKSGVDYVKRYSETGTSSASHSIMDLLRITQKILARNETELDLPFYERDEA